MNTTMNSVSNAHVANETMVRKGGIEQEKNRFDMWGGFFVGLVMSIFFTHAREIFHEPFFGWLFVILYVGMCIACFLSVYSIHWDEKQTKTTIKMSLVMSAILIPMMLMPFIMNIDTQVNFHECVGGGLGIEGNMHYFYKDYTDYSGVIMFGISIVFCIICMLRPLYHLYKMGK